VLGHGREEPLQRGTVDLFLRWSARLLPVPPIAVVAIEAGEGRAPSGARLWGTSYDSGEKCARHADAKLPLGGPPVLGTFVASTAHVAEEARTRGFAAPVFTGCVLVQRVGLI
jgi:hypothetical protein